MHCPRLLGMMLDSKSGIMPGIKPYPSQSGPDSKRKGGPQKEK
jgi:hypothetical protein